jgi:hypothetical protein
MSNMISWLSDRLDEQQHWNDGTGIAAWLTYLDENGSLLDTQLALATEANPTGWTVAASPLFQAGPT